MQDNNDKSRILYWPAKRSPVSTIEDFSDMYHRRIVNTVDLWRKERRRIQKTIEEYPFASSEDDANDRKAHINRILTLTYDHISTPQNVIERLNRLERTLGVFEHLGTHDEQDIHRLIISTLEFINEFRGYIGEWLEADVEAAA